VLGSLGSGLGLGWCVALRTRVSTSIFPAFLRKRPYRRRQKSNQNSERFKAHVTSLDSNALSLSHRCCWTGICLKRRFGM
jgi:hypothetical protein